MTLYFCKQVYLCRKQQGLTLWACTYKYLPLSLHLSHSSGRYREGGGASLLSIALLPLLLKAFINGGFTSRNSKVAKLMGELTEESTHSGYHTGAPPPPMAGSATELPPTHTHTHTKLTIVVHLHSQQEIIVLWSTKKANIKISTCTMISTHKSASSMYIKIVFFFSVRKTKSIHGKSTNSDNALVHCLGNGAVTCRLS